jgi:hypothetical protein
MKIKRRYQFLTYLFIVSLVFTGVSFSRFSSVINNTGAENTGSPGSPDEPGIEFSTWALEHQAAAVALENLEPGDVKTITIWVKNKNSAGTVSGYNQKVNLELTTTGNLPLEFTLHKTGGTPVALAHPDPYRYTSESQMFTANTGETKTFVLTITWPAGSRDYMYANEIDYIELKLKAVQA